MMKARKAWLGLLLIVFGLLFAALGSNIGQRELQKLKYGDPISFCVNDIGVRLGRTWQISLLRQAGGGALVGGLFPIPATFAEGSVNAQVLLKSSMHAGEVSIHLIEDNAVQESRDGALNACKANIYCKQEFSRFSREAEVVVEVRAGETTWIKYVDRPVMIGLHGQVMNDLEGIEIRTCPLDSK